MHSRKKKHLNPSSFSEVDILRLLKSDACGKSKKVSARSSVIRAVAFQTVLSHTQYEISDNEICREPHQSLLGEGGYGRVYRAKYNGRDVAVKEMKFKTQDMLQACEEEAEMMSELYSRLNMPNAIAYYGFTCDRRASKYSIVMECMHGGSLENWIDKVGQQENFDENWRLRYQWMRQLTTDLRFLHQHGIVHRDLGSKNIFLNGEEDSLKIGDYGFVAYSRGAVGTPCYMAPEVLLLMSAEWWEKTDIFGLGCIFWELATMQLIWGETEMSDQTDRVSRGEREEIPDKVPPKVASLIRWCWHQDPKMRPTAAVLKEVLDSDIDVMPAGLTL